MLTGLLVLLGLSAGTGMGILAHKAMSRDDEQVADPPIDLPVVATWEGRVVKVVTPHRGMANPHNAEVMQAPNIGSWTLEGYDGLGRAIWTTRCASAHQAEQVGKLIGFQEYLKANHERIFVEGRVTPQEQWMIDFVARVWEG